MSVPVAPHLAKGKQAEQDATAYLQHNGVRILHKNYRCKGGEIDIIAQDRKMLLFVEVRSRTSTLFGSAIETITLHKQKRIVKAARHYLGKYSSSTIPPCRFDAIVIDNHTLKWEKDCFIVG